MMPTNTDPIPCSMRAIAQDGVRPWKAQGQDLDDTPNLKRWFNAMYDRPAVQRGLKVLKDSRRQGAHSKEAWETLFGPKQYEKR